jgi:hypothetical protein
MKLFKSLARAYEFFIAIWTAANLIVLGTNEYRTWFYSNGICLEAVANLTLFAF